MQWISRVMGLKKPARRRMFPVFFTNTLSGKKELFVSQRPGLVLMYTCGPTMYGPAHIGNLRPYVLSDTATRALTAAGYRVRRVINITDFGHLVSDGDSGEDKMTKGLRREGLALTMENMRAMAEKYTATFIDDLAALNIDVEHVSFPRASDYIPEQIAFIKTLEQKGYAYRSKDGVYYDTSRFPGYGKLGGIALESQEVSQRMQSRSGKRHAADFVLWKPDPKLGWESPWGRGFPGWHIECSTMSRSLLGQELDIHMGGEDLIPIHHNNEIAQSEAISGRTFVHYWMHNAFLTMGGEKASKSLGNVVYLSDIHEKRFHPLALRYFFLQAHYRTPLSFSWDSIAAASSSLERLWNVAREIAEESRQKSAPSHARDQFLAALRDDLSTPQALGILWDSLKSDGYAPEEKWGLLEDAEAHFGLSLLNPPESRVALADLPPDIRELVARREKARIAKDFIAADSIRKEIGDRGYRVDDSPNGPVIKSL